MGSYPVQPYFEVTGNVTFQESSSHNIYYRKINNYKRTNRRHKLLGYLSNILGYPIKYCIYTSKKKLGQFPIPPPPPPWITFLISISQKIFLNIKDVEFDSNMGCILVIFPFLWIINMKFKNYRFLFFKISKICSFWSKITIFIIEISLKLLLRIKYGWNNPDSHRLGLKNQKWQPKNSSHTQTFKYISQAQFSWYTDFWGEMLLIMSSIRINNNWNYQNNHLFQYGLLKYNFLKTITLKLDTSDFFLFLFTKCVLYMYYI